LLVTRHVGGIGFSNGSPSSALKPVCSSKWRVITRCTTCSTGVNSTGCAASSRRSGMGPHPGFVSARHNTASRRTCSGSSHTGRAGNRAGCIRPCAPRRRVCRCARAAAPFSLSSTSGPQRPARCVRPRRRLHPIPFFCLSVCRACRSGAASAGKPSVSRAWTDGSSACGSL